MLEELQRRNYATTTVYYYLKAVEQFAKYFHTSPDQLNQSHLRQYQAYLLRERKLGPRTVKLHVSALRFFFVKTLKRPYLLEDLPFPKVPRRLRGVRPPVSGCRGDSPPGRRQPEAPGWRHRRLDGPAHVGATPPAPSPRPLRGAHGRLGAGRYPVDPCPSALLPPDRGLAETLSRQARGQPPGCLSRGAPRFPRRLGAGEAGDGLSRLPPIAVSPDVGRVRQAALWQSRPR